MNDEQARMILEDVLRGRTESNVARATLALRNADVSEAEIAETARQVRIDSEVRAALEIAKFIEWQMSGVGYDGRAKGILS